MINVLQIYQRPNVELYIYVPNRFKILTQKLAINNMLTLNTMDILYLIC